MAHEVFRRQLRIMAGSFGESTIKFAAPILGKEPQIGEIACSLNHLSCWEDAARRSVRFCIKFEDDMALKCNFEHIGTTIAGLDRFDRKWDLLYLERTYRRPGLPVGGGFVKPRFSYGTFAYCLSAPEFASCSHTIFDQC